jgi:hypothetical protein
LIPARNEAANLAELLPLLSGLPTYVFDDESDDETATVAASLGATVLKPAEALPPGWTGKNRACDALGRAALETGYAWLCFLDADARPGPEFGPTVSKYLGGLPARIGVVTGFPYPVPGRGIEPLFMAWVGWILLATNPFGLVSVTGKGHNRFTNGQIHAWRADIWSKLLPNEAVRGQILEDVMMGRLCAQRGVAVETLRLDRVLSVRMYETWQQAADGMSKNAYEIAGSVAGTLALAGLLLVVAWLWLLWWPAYLLLALSGALVAQIVRRNPLGGLVMPLALTIGAGILVRSLVWHRTGRVRWKGRVY